MKINGKTILSTLSTSTNFVLKQSSTTGTLINSQIFDDGTNIGIGTSSPEQLFTINRNIGNTTIGLYNSNSFSANRNWAITSNDQAYGDFALTQSNSLGGNPITDGTRRFYISASGNIGIGTTSPSNLLSITNNNLSTISLDWSGDNSAKSKWSANHSTGEVQFFNFTNYFPTFYSNNTERMRIDTSGNVGIGTSSPSSILHLNSEVPFLSIQGSTTGSLRGINIMQGSTVFSSLSAEASAGETRLSAGFSGWGGFQTFYTNGSERIRITSAGNVGIGISSPDSSALLEIRSSTQGFLPPRMTTSERDNINSPANGLMIFNTDNEQVDVFANGSGWRTIAWV